MEKRIGKRNIERNPKNVVARSVNGENVTRKLDKQKVKTMIIELVIAIFLIWVGYMALKMGIMMLFNAIDGFAREYFNYTLF